MYKYTTYINLHHYCKIEIKLKNQISWQTLLEDDWPMRQATSDIGIICYPLIGNVTCISNVLGYTRKYIICLCNINIKVQISQRDSPKNRSLLSLPPYRHSSFTILLWDINTLLGKLWTLNLKPLTGDKTDTHSYEHITVLFQLPRKSFEFVLDHFAAVEG